MGVVSAETLRRLIVTAFLKDLGLLTVFEPQNIEQGISNVEVTPFVILRFLVLHSIFNVFVQLQELHKIPPISCVDKSQR